MAMHNGLQGDMSLGQPAPVLPDEHRLAIIMGQLVEAGEQQEGISEHAGVHSLHQHTLQEVHSVGATFRRCQLRPLPQNAIRIHQLFCQCRMHPSIVAQTLKPVHDAHIALRECVAQVLIQLVVTEVYGGLLGEWPSGTSHTIMAHRQAGRTGAREAEERKLLRIAKRRPREEKQCGAQGVQRAEPEVKACKNKHEQMKTKQNKNQFRQAQGLPNTSRHSYPIACSIHQTLRD